MRQSQSQSNCLLIWSNRFNCKLGECFISLIGGQKKSLQEKKSGQSCVTFYTASKLSVALMQTNSSERLQEQVNGAQIVPFVFAEGHLKVI